MHYCFEITGQLDILKYDTTMHLHQPLF